MAEPRKRLRRKEAGFIGVDLAIGNDMTLYDRFVAEVQSDPELNQSKLIRIALRQYFDRKDGKNG